MNTARIRRLARSISAELAENKIANLSNDTSTAAFTQKVPSDHPDYKARVAEPTMAAIDDMPKPYRELVHDYGYVDVFRAWRRGRRPEMIRAQAEHNGGRFVL